MACRIKQEGNDSRCRGYGLHPHWEAEPKPVAILMNFAAESRLFGATVTPLVCNI